MYETQKDQLEQQSWNMQQAGMMQDNLKSRCHFSIFSFFVLLPLLLPLHSGATTLSTVGAICWAGSVLIRPKRRFTDVMITVDAMKTTNKELKKQYGKVDIDKSR
jgi:charged multivesicular body protein 5